MGLLRFLSHAETLRMLQRACRRANIDLAYSSGFNPHPKISLPLPRSVGMESEDEICLIRLKQSSTAYDVRQIKGKLGRELPKGFEITRVEILDREWPFQGGVVSYSIPIRDEFIDEQLNEKIKAVMESEQLIIRRSGQRKGQYREVDLRGFLESIEADQDQIIVRCKFGPVGTIRPDELLEILGLNVSKLAGPIRRVRVDWQQYAKNK